MARLMAGKVFFGPAVWAWSSSGSTGVEDSQKRHSVYDYSYSSGRPDPLFFVPAGWKLRDKTTGYDLDAAFFAGRHQSAHMLLGVIDHVFIEISIHT